ncbi:porin [Mesosutterella sp. OilRF-GAM-744-9]|uniref:Porin n=1 Tax=Mesosutterella porci TaxID=2915351 RepID=A0ABS9MPP8_9BURK|nr:porin [Mesosutterella sp. oilRF-744-WT-GAM-9]MCG5030595.1 porin [Mesosutterella sp. oilRF-744-WT-GAM-9]
MKKTLLAAALLGTFAASVFAAPSVTLYGRIDTGLVYSHDSLSVKGVEGLSHMSEDSVEMKSGWSTGSRWGLKGTEDLGNVKVGFVLENGFNGDDGTGAQSGRMFGREALVSVSGAYGTLYAGRMLSLASDGGSIGMLGETSAFGNAYGVASMKGSTGSAFARYDNTIAYASPTFAGFSAKAMYSFKGDSSEKDADNNVLAENKAESTRYAAAGLQYKAGAFTGVLTAEYTMWGNANWGKLDDGVAVILGGNYDFGVAKAFAKAAYFDNAASVEDTFEVKAAAEELLERKFALKGWGAEIGTNVPAFGGNFLAAVGYRDAEVVDFTDVKAKRWNAAIGYTYAFSKRTNVYGAAGYAQEKVKGYGVSLTPKETQVGVGLVHKF